MQVMEILQRKGYQVHSIHPQASLADVVQQLVHHNCGSLIVMQQDVVEGIITERDILRASADDHRLLAEIPVTERMTRNVVTGSPSDDVNDIMGLMTEKRLRHLPILNGESLAGLISIGDIVKAQHDRLSMENQALKDYIHG